MHGFVQNIGRTALNFLAAFGRITLFSITAVRWIFTPPYYWQQLFRQIIDIGYFSLPVVGLTTLFSGMVLALQSYTGFARFSAEDTVATINPANTGPNSRVTDSTCLLYTSPSPRDGLLSRMPSSA